MKQSKDEYAKKIADFAEAMRDVGAAEAKYEYAAEIQKLVGGLLAITNKLAALGGVDCTVEVQRNSFTKEKPQAKKRKAVEASAECIMAVTDVFEKYPNSVILPKNLDIGFGLRMVSAACRNLAESHVLEKVGTKGYRRIERKENGLDETTLPSE